MTSALLTGSSWVGQGLPCSDQAMTSSVEAGVTQTATKLMSAVQRHPVLKAAKCDDMGVQRLEKDVFGKNLEWIQKVPIVHAFLLPPYW